jgi:hypothetical protein
VQAATDAKRVEHDQQQRQAERRGHHANRRRQADETVIQVRQQRSNDEAERDDVEHGQPGQSIPAA